MDVKAVNQTQAALSMHSSTATGGTQQAVRTTNEQNPESGFQNLPQDAKNDIINKTVEKLNEKMDMLQTSLKIEVDEDTGIQVVKIVNDETKEVIKQLPPETMLKIAKYIDEITGLLFEKKV